MKLCISSLTQLEVIFSLRETFFIVVVVVETGFGVVCIVLVVRVCVVGATAAVTGGCRRNDSGCNS